MVEYGAVILLIAAIALAVFGRGIPEKIVDLYASGMAHLEDPSGTDQAAPEHTADPGSVPETEYWNSPVNEDSSGHDPAPPPGHPAGPPEESDYDPAPPPGHPAGPPEKPYSGPDPDDADPQAVESALEGLAECLDEWNEDVPWVTSGCSWDTIQDLSPEEFAAIVEELSAQDLKRIFDHGPIPLEQAYFDFLAEVRRTASLETLRTLMDASPHFFSEPDFSTVGGDPASGNSPGDLEYGELDDYTLFGDGDEPIQWEHIHQRALGDCWLMATMGAMAVQSPGAIQDMIQENANGTFTVTFPGHDPITVTPDLPLDTSGEPAFASSNEDPPVIWPAILEKAYAEMKGGDYGKLENWHPGAAMTTFGGDTVDYIPDFTGTTMDDLADKFENGEAITLATPLDTSDKKDLINDGTLVTAHVYFVTDVDRESGEVTVRNPWGTDYPDIVMSIDEINDNFAAIHSSDLG